MRGTPTQFSWIELDNFTTVKSPNADYPELAGKGGEKRHLLPAVLEVFRELKGDTEYEDHMERPMHHMAEFYHILEAKDAEGHIPAFLSVSQIDEMQSHIDEFHFHYMWLTDFSLKARVKQWNVVPKFHMLYHVGQQAKYLNPRLVPYFC